MFPASRSLVGYVFRGALQDSNRQKFWKAFTSTTTHPTKMTTPLDQVPDVDIDPSGVFKYILINVHDDKNDKSKPIVRGYARSTWHA
ncbi:14 kDa phosphohistidine phosphatase-like [Orussus abietinus]|uniref:14 kDa phosphohistidine phosphatase-like n=1 Tax=Orussus abietinus TaxID=222816 RepID=UPI0006264499|nr:14 kDa phosphohistidine phosphatase-like [Orussus abietinus]